MRAIRILITNALLVLAATSFSVVTARADTYGWTNLQSDIAGVATHLDRNLVNPWGMAVSPNGTIWVSDNGTGVSTLYHQDGTAVSLVVTIPTAARNKEGGRRVSIFCYLEGRSAVENHPSGVAPIFIPSGGRNRHHKRWSRAVLMVKR